MSKIRYMEERDKALKSLYEIESILNTTNVYVHKGQELPGYILAELLRLDNLGFIVRQYVEYTEDEKFMKIVSGNPALNWIWALSLSYRLPQNVRDSLVSCRGCLSAVQKKYLTSIKEVANCEYEEYEERIRFYETGKIAIPDELNTDAARAVLQRAIDAGFLDEKYQPVAGKMTRGQQKAFAIYASKELGLRRAWKPFELLWNCKHLQQVNIEDTSEERVREIAKMFSKEVIQESKLYI